MSGLNDDIEQDALPVSLIPLKVGNNSTDTANISLVPSDETKEISLPSVKELFGNVEPNILPNITAAIVLVEESSDKTNDLASIKETLLSKASCSQEDIKVVDIIVPGFISPNNPLNAFTELSTKTNFFNTIRGVELLIEKEKKVQADLITSVFTSVKETIKQARYLYNIGVEDNKQLPNFLDTFKEVSNQLNLDCNDLDKDFFNNVYKDGYFRVFIVNWSLTERVMKGIDLNTTPFYPRECINLTYNQLLGLLKSDGFTRYLETYKGITEDFDKLIISIDNGLYQGNSIIKIKEQSLLLARAMKTMLCYRLFIKDSISLLDRFKSK
jgi:hypothetical protein